MKAVICGAGIAGLTAAHELAELDWEVTVLEEAPAPRTQGYMIDFFGPGYDAAERTYVLPRLAEAGYQVDELRYHDDTGRTRARLSYRRIADALDGRVFSIMRPDLETALREALPAGVRQLFGTSVRSVDDHGDGVEVTTTRGLVLHADLLVGADGVHSRIRRLVFGPERDYLRYLGFHTAAFTFRDTAVRDEIGDAVCLTESIDRQIGLYGLHDGRVAVFAVQPVLADCLREATSVEQGLDEYERIFRPVAEEKQRVAVKAVRWFLPHTRTQPRIRRAALTLARIPVFTRYVAGAMTGKAANLLRASQREAA